MILKHFTTAQSFPQTKHSPNVSTTEEPNNEKKEATRFGYQQEKKTWRKT